MQFIQKQAHDDADNNIEKLCIELEQEEKYFWETPFNGILL